MADIVVVLVIFSVLELLLVDADVGQKFAGSRRECQQGLDPSWSVGQKLAAQDHAWSMDRSRPFGPKLVG